MPSVHRETRRARKVHHCGVCQDDIKPGDLYERDVHMVYAGGRTRFSVWKVHDMMWCVIEEEMLERARVHAQVAVAVVQTIELRQVIKLGRNGEPIVESVPYTGLACVTTGELDTFGSHDDEIPF
jgi:hypothetical protein